MTIEAMRSYEHETTMDSREEEHPLAKRARLAIELAGHSIKLAEANKAYNDCIVEMIQTNEEIGRLGLSGFAISRIREMAAPHELIIE